MTEDLFFTGGNQLRLTTLLADLQTTLPLDLTSGLQITNNGQTYTIDTSAAATVEDLLGDWPE